MICPFIKRVIAVVVSYNPDINEFSKLLEVLLPQVAYAIVVDNASRTDIAPTLANWPDCNVELLQMPENLGIAAAQNIGIERAIRLEADFVLLLDQDSLPSISMVNELYAALVSAQSDQFDIPVAAVGPTIVDRSLGRIYYFMTERMGFPCKWLPPGDINKLPLNIDATVLAASGMLIPIDVIKSVGGMRTNYFINHVDTEWCMRAKAAGYRLLGVPSSKLEHRFGDTIKQIWFFGYRQVIYHTPLRNYYDIRNTLLMLSVTSMSWTWKIHFILRLLRLGYFLVFAEDRWLRLKRIILGILHARKGVSGCLDTKTNRCHFLPVSDIEHGLRV